MSSTSRERRHIDPDGTAPLVEPGEEAYGQSDGFAEAQIALFEDVETQRWLDWFDSVSIFAPFRPGSGDQALVDLWSAVLEGIEQGWFTGCTWSDVAANPPVPLWLRLRPGMEEFFGLHGCRLTAGVVAGVTRWMQLTWGATWVVTEYDPHVADAGKPLLAVPGGRGFLPQEQIPSGVLAALGLFRPPEREPDRLKSLLYRFGPGTGSADDHTDSDEPQFLLDPWDDPQFNWRLSTDDWTAHVEEERVEQLVVLLADTPGVARCIHEDRELILLRSELDRDRLMALVEDLWELTAGQAD